MLMFHFHVAFVLGLIALTLGAMLLAKTKQIGKGMMFCKIIAYIVILLALLNIVCSSYYSIKFWRIGYMQQPCPMMMMKGEMMKSMMQDNMMQKPMMTKPMLIKSR